MTRTGLAGFIVIGLALSVVFVAIRARAELGSGPLLGYAWSETVGWVDLNCQNSNTCSSIPWGFSVDTKGVLERGEMRENGDTDNRLTSHKCTYFQDVVRWVRGESARYVTV
jgi:hypothetical protein